MLNADRDRVALAELALRCALALAELALRQAEAELAALHYLAELVESFTLPTA